MVYGFLTVFQHLTSSEEHILLLLAIQHKRQQWNDSDSILMSQLDSHCKWFLTSLQCSITWPATMTNIYFFSWPSAQTPTIERLRICRRAQSLGLSLYMGEFLWLPYSVPMTRPPNTMLRSEAQEAHLALVAMVRIWTFGHEVANRHANYWVAQDRKCR